MRVYPKELWLSLPQWKDDWPYVGEFVLVFGREAYVREIDPERGAIGEFLVEFV